MARGPVYLALLRYGFAVCGGRSSVASAASSTSTTATPTSTAAAAARTAASIECGLGPQSLVQFRLPCIREDIQTEQPDGERQDGRCSLRRNHAGGCLQFRMPVLQTVEQGVTAPAAVRP